MTRLKFYILAIVLGMGAVQALAQDIVTFGPQEAKITGSIHYTAIGRYKARFRTFKGRITLDDNGQRIQSVYLEIDARSITSNCPWCDRAARSRRLLNTFRFPKIIFKSDKIIKGAGGYMVKGTLEMHGIRRKMMFPFIVHDIVDQENKQEILVLKGSWNINRKDFNIIWSKYLDRGGILVGDIFTVDWGVSLFIRPNA